MAPVGDQFGPLSVRALRSMSARQAPPWGSGGFHSTLCQRLDSEAVRRWGVRRPGDFGEKRDRLRRLRRLSSGQ